MKTLRKLAQCENGGVTVEFVLWLPVYFVLLMVVFDSTLVFAYKNRIEQVTQTAVRQISVGALDDADLSAFIEGQGFKVSEFTASVTRTSDTVTVTLSVPTETAEFSGMVSSLGVAELSTSVTQRSEL